MALPSSSLTCQASKGQHRLWLDPTTSSQLPDKMGMAVLPTFLSKTGGDSISVTIICLAVKGIECMGASFP